MIQHRSTPGDPSATSSMDPATRQMPTANFYLRPASDVEILGITTATFLLALFLCYMLYVGLPMSSCVFLTKSYARDLPHIVKTSSGRDTFSQSVCEWTTIPLTRSRASYHGQHEEYQTPYFTCSAQNSRTKWSGETPITTKQYYYTRIRGRGKPLSRKPLLISNSVIHSIRQKDMALGMEEGLSLRPSTTAVVAGKYDNAIRPNETTSCMESEAKENRGHFDRSFLRHYTVSLR
ncbi:hypothetical protein GGR58DRAFT_524449 [Xylaria digitata]|nr:hypothetical protein GGR58DRAFT_524449 [Xylaria digitata]